MPNHPNHRIATLLRPRAIAIVGASPTIEKVSGRIASSIASGSYGGGVYPVNPRYEEVYGYRCYPSLNDLPGPVDHCIIALPAAGVPEVLLECRRLGIGAATIIASGYAEAGAEGAALQQELVEAAGDMVFLGPNSIGFANLTDGLFATSVPTLARQKGPGDVALVSQSGGLAFSVSWAMAEAHIDLSYLVLTGNAAGVSFAELLEFFFDDKSTRVVVMLIEGDNVLGELLSVVGRRGLVKPVVLLKVGRGATGMVMAQSHTGSLAGDYRVARDCAEQAGMVFADDIDEAVGCANLLRNGLNAAHGDNIAAFSVSGGNVVLFADQADFAGVRFAGMTEETRRRLRAVLPEYIAVQNPVDLTTAGYVNPALQDKVVDILADDPGITTIVPIITAAADYTRVCRSLAELNRRVPRPLVLMWTGGSYETKSPQMLADAGIPVFRTPNVLMRSFNALKRAAVPASPANRAAWPSKARAVGNTAGSTVTLSESESLAFLATHGVPAARFAATKLESLVATGDALGYPLVLKLDVPDTHISDSGGVALDLRSAQELAQAAEAMLARAGSGAATPLIVSQFRPGIELIASVFVHPVFGPLLMTGSGGVWTEAMADVRFVRLPAVRTVFAEALGATAMGKVLRQGSRGATGFDAAVDLLERLAACFLEQDGNITQIELNPVTVGRHGACAVDASVVRAAP